MEDWQGSNLITTAQTKYTYCVNSNTDHLKYKSCLLKLQIYRCVQKANVGSNKKATRCQ